MLSAHLDTVPVDGRDRGRARGRASTGAAGDTILGADDKAARDGAGRARRAALRDAAAGRARARVHGRGGGRPARGEGARPRLAAQPRTGSCSTTRARSARSPIAVTDLQAAGGGVRPGVEAHAGIRPEDGRSAIAAAAAAVNEMKLGRLDPETTANVGVVEGGTAANVVPGPVPDRGRGARDRRRARRGGDRGDGRRVHVGGGRAQLRRRRRGDRDVPRLPPAAGIGGGRRREAGAGCARPRACARSRPAAAATRTRSARRGSTRCCSPTGPRRTTPPRRAWRRSGIVADARRLRGDRRAGGGALSGAEAAPRRRHHPPTRCGSRSMGANVPRGPTRS